MSYKKTLQTLVAGALLATGSLLATHTSLFAQSTANKSLTVVAEAAPSEPGVLITSTRPDSPAATAGLRRGDIVLRVDGVAVNSDTELRTKISGKKAGETVTLTVLHGDDERELIITLAPRDDTGVLGVTAQHAPAADVMIFSAQGAMPAQGLMPFAQAQPLAAPLPPGAGTVTATLHLQITEVSPDTPAAAAGLQAGELIVALNGEPLATPEALSVQVTQSKPGDKVLLTLKASPDASETREVEITLGERKEQPGQAYLGIRFAPMFMIEREGMLPGDHFIARTDGMTEVLVAPFAGTPAQAGVSVEMVPGRLTTPPLFSMAQGMICMPASAGAVMAPGQPFAAPSMTMPAPPIYFWQQQIDDGVSISGSVQAPDVLQFEQAVPAPISEEI